MLITSVSEGGMMSYKKYGRIVALIALLSIFILTGGLLKGVARAATDPTVIGGADVTGLVDTDVAISDIQISGGEGTVPVDLYVPYGTLSMVTTTGLTFTTGASGDHLAFSGSLTDVNNALATLHYRSDRVKNIQLQVSVLNSGLVYNPDNGHLYKVVEPGDGINAVDARTAAAASTANGVPGYLVTITSQAENDFVHDRVNTDSWLGATDAASEGVWKWDQGPEAGT